MALLYLQDSLETTLCLKYNSHSIALAALYITCKCLNFSPPEIQLGTTLQTHLNTEEEEGMIEDGEMKETAKELYYFLQQGISFCELAGTAFLGFGWLHF